jgi:hypothetical protein
LIWAGHIALDVARGGGGRGGHACLEGRVGDLWGTWLGIGGGLVGFLGLGLGFAGLQESLRLSGLGGVGRVALRLMWLAEGGLAGGLEGDWVGLVLFLLRGVTGCHTVDATWRNSGGKLVCSTGFLDGRLGRVTLGLMWRGGGGVGGRGGCRRF